MTLNLSVHYWFKVQSYLQLFCKCCGRNPVISKGIHVFTNFGWKFFACRICNENSQFCRNVANVTTLLDFHCVEQLGKRCFVFGKLCFPHSRLSIWKPQRMGRSVIPSAPEHQLSGTLQRAVLNLISYFLFFLLKCNLMKRCIMTILDVLIK